MLLKENHQFIAGYKYITVNMNYQSLIVTINVIDIQLQLGSFVTRLPLLVFSRIFLGYFELYAKD